MNQNNREIEAKFLEVDQPTIARKLLDMGAEDLGPDDLREIVFYDAAMTWPKRNIFLRLRSTKKGVIMTYKESDETSLSGTLELETGVASLADARKILEAVGLVAFREQEKRRHSYRLGEVMVDFDTWPGIPTYVEIEGPSEESVQDVAARLGFDWSQAVYGTASHVIQDVYHVPVKSYRYFTFAKQE